MSVGITLHNHASYYLTKFFEAKEQGGNNIAEFLVLRTAVEHAIVQSLLR